MNKVLELADMISNVGKAFERIKMLEESQREFSDLMRGFDKRIRELEASTREMKSEIKFEALKETQSAINGVQGKMFEIITDLAVKVDRLDRNVRFDGTGKDGSIIGGRILDPSNGELLRSQKSSDEV